MTGLPKAREAAGRLQINEQWIDFLRFILLEARRLGITVETMQADAIAENGVCLSKLETEHKIPVDTAKEALK